MIKSLDARESELKQIVIDVAEVDDLKDCLKLFSLQDLSQDQVLIALRDMIYESARFRTFVSNTVDKSCNNSIEKKLQGL